MFASGTVIAHFTLEKEIGRGGQGAVYRAEDQRSGKKVALKVLRVGTELPYKMFERFQREADITRKLDHPGICAVYENGTEGDIAWISMRLLTGQPLARTWAAPPETPNEMMLFESDAGGVKVRTISSVSTMTPPPAPNIVEASPMMGRGSAAAIREAVRVVEACARALHAAHEAGVIHRDVKPSNIMITTSGDPIILDFGLARDGGDDNVSLTMSGTAVGTPSYMAPEQLRTNTTPIGRSVDIWALGVTLYESLAHRRPFEASTRDGLYRSILTEDPRPIRSGHPEIPEDVDAIIGMCLEKNPADRYVNALELAEDLHRARMGEPVLARRANLITRFTRFCARSPGIAAMVLGSFFILVASLGVAAVFAKTTSDSANALQNALSETRAEQKQKVLALQRADASLIAAKALSLVERDPALALALGIEASKRGAGIAADTAMLSALGSLNEVRSFKVPGATEVHRVGSHTIAVVAEGNASRLLVVDAKNGKPGQEIGVCSGFSLARDSSNVLLLTQESTSEISAKIVNIQSSETLIVPALITRGATGACISPDASRIAVWRQNGTFTIREVNTWREVAVGASRLNVVRIDGSFLDSSLLCFRIANEILPFLEIHDTVRAAEPYRILMAETTRAEPVLIGASNLAVAQGDVVKTYDLRTPGSATTLSGHRGTVTGLTVLKGSGFLASSSEDGTIRLWPIRAGGTGSVLRGAPGAINGITAMGDDHTLVSVAADSQLTVWDRRLGHPLTAGEFARDRASRDRIILSAFGDLGFRGALSGFRTIDTWRRGRTEITRGRGALNELIAVSADGRIGASANTTSNTLRTIWFNDLQTQNHPTVSSPKIQGELVAIALSPDGSRAAVTLNRRSRLEPIVEIIDTRTGQRTLARGLRRVDGWSDDGQRYVGELVSDRQNPNRREFGAVDAETGAVVFRVGTSTPILQVAPFPDGQSIALVTEGGAILRGSAAGLNALIDRSHRSTPRVRIAHDGAHILTFSEDRDAALWNVATGAEVMRVRVGNPIIEDVALTRDGEHLVVGTSDGRVTDWPMNVRAFAETHMPRPLTESDMRIFGLSNLGATSSQNP